MKGLHVHVGVADIGRSARLYASLFATEPAVLSGDYAKWMLEDPRVNIAISKRGTEPGIAHFGIQVENTAELDGVFGRLTQAERPVIERRAATCRYANSDKQWTADPEGIDWEMFLTFGESTAYSRNARIDEFNKASCCTPAVTVRGP